MSILILSDGRPGHENQSLAFAKHLGLNYELIHVSYPWKGLKLLSYLFDFLGLHVKLFSYDKEPKNVHDYVVATGSTTYYPAKYFSKKLQTKSIALMLPKNYQNTFDKVFAMEHDTTTLSPNMTSLPINICYSEPKGLYTPKKEAIGIIIGGNNSTFAMNTTHIKKVLETIKTNFSDHEIAITTSPRTPAEVETIIEEFQFDYEVIYSKNKDNPIADFLFTCNQVFITEDSTSMISEAACFGNASIEIISLETSKPENKYRKFVKNLAQHNYVHLYDGNFVKTQKFPLHETLTKAMQ